MTPKEIIVNHVANNGLSTTPGDLAYRINSLIENGGAQMVQQGDCLFLFQGQKENVVIYIVNGGDARNYLRSLASFVSMMKKLGVKNLLMRVSDVNSAKRIAKSAGVKNSTAELTDQYDVDPYTLNMEI